MKTWLYWTIRHMNRRMHDLRFAVSCWSLSQRVDFLEWRWRLNVLMPQPQTIPAPVPAQQRGCYAVNSP